MTNNSSSPITGVMTFIEKKRSLIPQGGSSSSTDVVSNLPTNSITTSSSNNNNTTLNADGGALAIGTLSDDDQAGSSSSSNNNNSTSGGEDENPNNNSNNSNNLSSTSPVQKGILSRRSAKHSSNTSPSLEKVSVPKRTNRVSFSSSEDETIAIPAQQVVQPQPSNPLLSKVTTTNTNNNNTLSSPAFQPAATPIDTSSSKDLDPRRHLKETTTTTTTPITTTQQASNPIPVPASSSAQLAGSPAASSASPSSPHQNPGLKYRPSHSSLGFNHTPSPTFRSKGWASGGSSTPQPSSISNSAQKKKTGRHQSAGSPTVKNGSGLFPRINQSPVSASSGFKTSAQILNNHVQSLREQENADSEVSNVNNAATHHRSTEEDYNEEGDDEEEENDGEENAIKRSGLADDVHYNRNQHERKRRAGSRVSMSSSPTKQLWAGNEQ